MTIVVPQTAATTSVAQGATEEDEAFRQKYSYMSAVNYIGDPAAVHRGPQAFLVDIGQEHVIEPHFHQVDQFQIFVRGEATIGKHPIEPVTVHYADGYTPYGPIRCGGGGGGVAFFNLRAHADVGAHWMPGSRQEMPRRAGRHRTVLCELTDPAEAGLATRVDLFEPEPDGLCAFKTIAGPKTSLPDEVAGGSGRYELVLRGSLNVDGELIPEHSIVFSKAGEALPQRRAGDSGVQVLTVQAPL